ncbi:MAG: hypothetical protein ACT4OZ_04735 [Gemmatimonadota bacterium]
MSDCILSRKEHNPVCSALRSVVCTLAVVAAGGCHFVDGVAAPVDVSPREIGPEMVTGSAAAALVGGVFILPLPAATESQLPLDTALVQAREFARYVTNNVNLRGVVEAGRGGYWVEPHRLLLCARPVSYVRPQLEPVSVDSLPVRGRNLLLRKFGPQWIIALCGSEGEPQMTVQIALEGNPVRFQGGAPVVSDPDLLSAFSPAGVPLNWPDALPLSAERAARYVFDQFGVRIAEPPQLFVRGDTSPDGTYDLQGGGARNCNRWRIVLERPVNTQRAAGDIVRMSSEIFVSSLACVGTDTRPVLQLPTGLQSSGAFVRYTDFSVAPQRTWRIPVRLVSPVRFELIEPAR